MKEIYSKTNYFFKALAIIFIIIAGNNSAKVAVQHFPTQDSCVFISGGFHLLQGKVLYKEIWDHKPPMVFLLNAAALKFKSQSIHSIWFMERLFAIIAAMLLLCILHLILKDFWVSFFGSIMYLSVFYSPQIFDGGNLSEEYGAFFVIIGILFSILSIEIKKNKNNIQYIYFFNFMSGLFFSLAVFTKEPFILSSIIWFVYQCDLFQGVVKKSLKRGGAFLVGAFVPAILFFIYLAVNSALVDWFDVFSYSFYNQETSFNTLMFRICHDLILFPNNKLLNTSPLFFFLCSIAVISILDRNFLIKYRYIAVFLLAGFIFDNIGSLISSREYNHYKMQVVPSLILLSSIGLKFIISNTLKQEYKCKLGKLAFLFIFFLIISKPNIEYYYKNFGADIKTITKTKISEYILRQKNNADSIWAPSYPYINVETGLTSPSKYIYILKHLFINTRYTTREQKIKFAKEAIIKSPPSYIYATDDTLKLCDLDIYAKENYVLTGKKSGKKFLLIHKDLKLGK